MFCPALDQAGTAGPRTLIPHRARSAAWGRAGGTPSWCLRSQVQQQLQAHILSVGTGSVLWEVCEQSRNGHEGGQVLLACVRPLFHM